jgi:hypothetical protein
LYLRYPQHAKLYLLQRDDTDIPMTDHRGSSNLTVPGLRWHTYVTVKPIIDEIDRVLAKRDELAGDEAGE